MRKNLIAAPGANQPSSVNGDRFAWSETPWFVYNPDNQTWGPGSSLDDERQKFKMDSPDKHKKELVVVTWNVLFDGLYVKRSEVP